MHTSSHLYTPKPTPEVQGERIRDQRIFQVKQGLPQAGIVANTQMDVFPAQLSAQLPQGGGVTIPLPARLSPLRRSRLRLLEAWMATLAVCGYA